MPRKSLNGFEPPKEVVPVIVCAACLFEKDGKPIIIAGARHFDSVMHSQLQAIFGDKYPGCREQGFIDQWGRYWGREEAMNHIKSTGQKFNPARQGNQDTVLYSEGLY